MATKKEIKNYAKEHKCSIREAQRQLGETPTGNVSIMSDNPTTKSSGTVMTFDGGQVTRFTDIDDLYAYHDEQRSISHQNFFGQFDSRLTDFSNNFKQDEYDYQKQYDVYWHKSIHTEELKDISFVKTVGVDHFALSNRIDAVKDLFLQAPFVDDCFDTDVLNSLITVEWINKKDNTGKIQLFVGTDYESVKCKPAFGSEIYLSKEAFNWMMLIWQAQNNGLNMEYSIFKSMISYSEADLFEFGIDKKLHPAILKNMPYPSIRDESSNILKVLD